MSDSKDTAARGPPAATGGPAVKTESASSMQSTGSAFAPRNQGGYLSKLFGIGSGKSSGIVDRSPAAPLDQAPEYHPGNRTKSTYISAVHRN